MKSNTTRPTARKLLQETMGPLLHGAERADLPCKRMLARLLQIERDGGPGEELDPRRLSVSQIERFTGITRQSILRWTKANGLVRNDDGSFDLHAVIRWMRKAAICRTEKRILRRLRVLLHDTKKQTPNHQAEKEQ